MKATGLQWFVWVQPLDPQGPDVMSESGRLLPEGDHETRERWIASVEATARSGRRPLSGGGFVATSPELALAEIPLTYRPSDHVPTALVAVPRRVWGSLEIECLLDDLKRTIIEAEHSFDPAPLRWGLDILAKRARPRWGLEAMR